MNKRTRKKWLKKQKLYVNSKEIWNLDCNIAKYILPRLKMYKKLTIAYPGYDEANTPEKWDEWDRCVPIRLDDLYEGMELGQCLDIIKIVKDDSIAAGIKVMKNQGHSGMSWGLMKSMIYTFCDCGKEFIEALDNM